jgi:hypothetical protein
VHADGRQAGGERFHDHERVDLGYGGGHEHVGDGQVVGHLRVGSEPGEVDAGAESRLLEGLLRLRELRPLTEDEQAHVRHLAGRTDECLRQKPHVLLGTHPAEVAEDHGVCREPELLARAGCGRVAERLGVDAVRKQHAVIGHTELGEPLLDSGRWCQDQVDIVSEFVQVASDIRVAHRLRHEPRVGVRVQVIARVVREHDGDPRRLAVLERYTSRNEGMVDVGHVECGDDAFGLRGEHEPHLPTRVTPGNGR